MWCMRGHDRVPTMKRAAAGLPSAKLGGRAWTTTLEALSVGVKVEGGSSEARHRGAPGLW